MSWNSDESKYIYPNHVPSMPRLNDPADGRPGAAPVVSPVLKKGGGGHTGNIAVCAIFKDEARDLMEWIAYHISIGFERFFLYDNNSSDGGAELLKCPRLSRFVTVIDWPETPGQLSAYDHFSKNFAITCDWVAFIDIDEFVFISGCLPVREFLNQYRDFSAVLVHWLSFGSSGFGGRPAGLILENYTKRCRYDFSNNRHVKSIVQCDKLIGPLSTPHVFDIQGLACNTAGVEVENKAIQDDICHAGAVICHFTIKSYEDWLAKMRRGKATTIDQSDMYNVDQFFSYDQPAILTDRRMTVFRDSVRHMILSWADRWQRISDTVFEFSAGLALVVRESCDSGDQWRVVFIDTISLGVEPAKRANRVMADMYFPSLVDAQVAVEQYHRVLPDLSRSAAKFNSSHISGEVPKTALRKKKKHIGSPRCVFHSASPLHYGNLMIRYLMALNLTGRIPGMQLSNFEMPYWSISYPSLSADRATKRFDLVTEQHVDFERLAYLVEAGLVDWIDCYGYGQRIEYFPEVEMCRKELSGPSSDSIGLQFDSRYLVCPIRGSEILDARHSGYVLLPATFYREIADKLSLKPVFIGQIEDNPYMNTIRKALPEAIFIPSQNPIWDFQTARSSKNIVVPVSTFGWLSAWLSHASQIILPVYGLFNPKQFPSHDLLPLSDSRYQFYEFPIHHAVPVQEVPRDHQLLQGRWELRDPRYFCRLE